MLASLGDAALDDPLFAFEPKYDGIRALVSLDPKAGARRGTRTRRAGLAIDEEDAVAEQHARGQREAHAVARSVALKGGGPKRPAWAREYDVRFRLGEVTTEKTLDVSLAPAHPLQQASKFSRHCVADLGRMTLRTQVGILVDSV